MANIANHVLDSLGIQGDPTPEEAALGCRFVMGENGAAAIVIARGADAMALPYPLPPSVAERALRECYEYGDHETFGSILFIFADDGCEIDFSRVFVNLEYSAGKERARAIRFLKRAARRDRFRSTLFYDVFLSWRANL